MVAVDPSPAAQSSRRLPSQKTGTRALTFCIDHLRQPEAIAKHVHLGKAPDKGNKVCTRCLNDRLSGPGDWPDTGYARQSNRLQDPSGKRRHALGEDRIFCGRITTRPRVAIQLHVDRLYCYMYQVPIRLSSARSYQYVLFS
jgi:hypothetical protein